jgi:DNA repair protein RadC
MELKRSTNDLNMTLIDHLILTKNGYLSFADDGLL